MTDLTAAPPDPSSPDPSPRPRNRVETESALRRAARDLLANSGFQGLGINAIARRAGCDKQLIYRYFGGLDGLMAAVGADLADWIGSALDPETAPASYADLVASMLLRLADALRHDPLIRQIAAWEVIDPTPLVQPLARARSVALTAWVEARRGTLRPPPGVDAPALIALLVAAVQHLAMAEASMGRFSGLTLDEPGWRRLQTMLTRIVQQQLGDAQSTGGCPS